MSILAPRVSLDLCALRAKLGRPLVMGILNATPDSFYEGSRSQSLSAAVAHGLSMAEEGADILDIGGESTRPGSIVVGEAEEIERVVPVVRELARRTKVPISVDTSKPAVAVRALDAGAVILNDVRALREPGMSAAAAGFSTVILMHMLGESPRTMQSDPRYKDPVSEIAGFLGERISVAREAGITKDAIWIDPGIGFGKTVSHNAEIMSRINELASLAPVLIGASRKSFIGKILAGAQTPAPPEDRLEGSLAAACAAAKGGAVCVRVHDVLATLRALSVWAACSGGAQ